MRARAWIIVFIAHGESDPPAGHVVTLRKREKFHADILGARYLQKTRRLVAVEGQIGVGEIMDDDKIMLPRCAHHALEEIQLDDFRRRVMRKTDDQHLRLRPGLLDRLFEVGEESLAGRQRQATQITAGQDHGELVDRVSRARA